MSYFRGKLAGLALLGALFFCAGSEGRWEYWLTAGALLVVAGALFFAK